VRTLTVLGVVLLALTAGFAITALTRVDDGEADRPADSRNEVVGTSAEPTGARTSLPGLVPARGEPDLPGLVTVRPAPGAVARLVGPFDDRFRLSQLDYAGGRVSGVLSVTSDVSELLELQVLAGFYDGDGRLLSTGRFVHHLDGGHGHAGADPHANERFSIAAPRRIQPRAVSAAVGVPVLVNE
jgi:hypothetical protein